MIHARVVDRVARRESGLAVVVARRDAEVRDLGAGGAAPTTAGSVDLTNSGIDLHSGHTFNVAITYDGTTLKVTMTDAVTGKSSTQSYAVNIPAAVGGNTAYVGFTAGTGGLAATQDILSWTYSAQ